MMMFQIGVLASLCYNCGVDSFQKKQFQEAASWLKESFSIGKIENAVSPADQAGNICSPSKKDKKVKVVNLYSASSQTRL